jgi:hypothetical protein
VPKGETGARVGRLRRQPRNLIGSRTDVAIRLLGDTRAASSIVAKPVETEPSQAIRLVSNRHSLRDQGSSCWKTSGLRSCQYWSPIDIGRTPRRRRDPLESRVVSSSCTLHFGAVSEDERRVRPGRISREMCPLPSHICNSGGSGHGPLRRLRGTLALGALSRELNELSGVWAIALLQRYVTNGRRSKPSTPVLVVLDSCARRSRSSAFHHSNPPRGFWGRPKMESSNHRGAGFPAST